MKCDYPATSRNREPLLAALRAELPPRARVLEVACGSGQHAAYFAAAEPGWSWQPTSMEAHERTSADAWCAERDNVASALCLDVLQPWPVAARSVDAVFCANMLHIAPWPCTPALMRGAARVLVQGGRLVVYGPFSVDGVHTAPSNEAFDRSLRLRDPAWGVRDRGAVVAEALAAGLVLDGHHDLPANNQLLVFRR